MPAIRIANGLRMFYREHGSGDRVVLLIHGNAASSLWWERAMAGLPVGVRAVAPDLRGCGDSDKPAPAWSMNDLAEDVFQLTRALGLGRFTVVGHSLGGGVAQYLTVNHPEAVEKLVLINSAPSEGLKTPPERYAQLEAAVKMPVVLKMALAAMMPTAPKDEYYDRLLEESVTKSAAALIPNGRALDDMDLTGPAALMQVPTLILYGKQDMLVTLEMMERTRQTIPGAVLEVWDEVGHSAPVEDPPRFTKRLLEFLA
ncbi:MAG TPA: alpha/beta hydrolase [Symbiobacteriaceae bacterium]|nr:alpha/beta hydrolase [Symbiobacteriaceae bacterium]